MSVLDIMLNTWSNIDIPPKPNNIADKITLVEISLQGIAVIFWTPFVSSIIPDTKPLTNPLLVIPNILKIGSSAEDIILIKLLFSSIESTTLKSTTNPPIINIVLVAEEIELLKTSPRLENDTVEGLVLYIEAGLVSVLLLLYKDKGFFVGAPFAGIPIRNDTTVPFFPFPKPKNKTNSQAS